jgi:pyruvate/2-oxoglutarate dehydrogenase complex dihydrolipoamide acyltransferase (E2) component
MKSEAAARYTTESFPKIRRATVELLKAAKQKHMIHSLIEVDITGTRKQLKTLRRETNAYYSFTGYIVSCVSKAVAQNKRMHAYRNRKNQLVLFEDVDVSTTIERRIRNRSEVVALIIRGANHKSTQAISEEIRKEKAGGVEQAEVFRSMNLFLAIPPFFRKGIFRLMDRSPKLMKKRAGTIMVTSANLVGKGAGWGIPIATHTLNITIGGIAERVREREGQIETRECLCLTVSFDHDIIDGAPAARFVRDLKKIIERNEVET